MKIKSQSVRSTDDCQRSDTTTVQPTVATRSGKGVPAGPKAKRKRAVSSSGGACKQAPSKGRLSTAIKKTKRKKDGVSASLATTALATRKSEDMPPDAVDGADHWNDRVQSHRRRQASVAAILDETFGQLAESDPELWARRAYLMLVGIVYERLATDESEIPTEELIALAKLLAESRRADNQARDRKPVADESDQGGAQPPSNDNGRLPDAFGDVVRQIYGTSLPKPKGR